MVDGENRPRAVWRIVRKAWIPIAVVLVAASLIGAWFYLTNDRDYTCTYELFAQSTSGDVFTVYVPVPVNYASTSTANLLEQAIFGGALSREIVNTSYGTALKVTADGTLGVEWSSGSVPEVDRGFFSCITMHNTSTNITTGMTSTWLFCDDPNVSLHLSYEASSHRHVTPWFVSGSDIHYEFLMTGGATGWRPVPTEHEWEVAN